MPGPLRTIGCLRPALQPGRIRRADLGGGRRRCLVPAGTKGRGQPTMSTARVTAVGYGGSRCCAAPKGPPILSERSEARDRRRVPWSPTSAHLSRVFGRRSVAGARSTFAGGVLTSHFGVARPVAYVGRTLAQRVAVVGRS